MVGTDAIAPPSCPSRSLPSAGFEECLCIRFTKSYILSRLRAFFKQPTALYILHFSGAAQAATGNWLLDVFDEDSDEQQKETVSLDELNDLARGRAFGSRSLSSLPQLCPPADSWRGLWSHRRFARGARDRCPLQRPIRQRRARPRTQSRHSGALSLHFPYCISTLSPLASRTHFLLLLPFALSLPFSSFSPLSPRFPLSPSLFIRPRVCPTSTATTASNSGGC